MAQLKNNIKTIEPSIFLLKDAELWEIADRYRIYAGRIFVEFFPALGFIDNFLPKHISHEYSDAMKQKSNIITMPVLMKYEKKILIVLMSWILLKTGLMICTAKLTICQNKTLHLYSHQQFMYRFQWFNVTKRLTVDFRFQGFVLTLTWKIK